MIISNINCYNSLIKNYFRNLINATVLTYFKKPSTGLRQIGLSRDARPITMPAAARKILKNREVDAEADADADSSKKNVKFLNFVPTQPSTKKYKNIKICRCRPRPGKFWKIVKPMPVDLKKYMPMPIPAPMPIQIFSIPRCRFRQKCQRPRIFGAQTYLFGFGIMITI